MRNNHFTNNFKNWQVEGNATGGTIFIDQCADTVEITGNTTFAGPALSERTAGASGLELWGRNITVMGNVISGYPSEGIGVNSASNVTITSNSTLNNATRTDAPLSGISAQTAGPTACGPIPRDVQTVSMSANTSMGQPYGVLFGDRDPGSRNTVNGVTICGNNALVGTSGINISQHPVVTLNNYSDSGLGTTLGLVEDTHPRALAIDAVSPGTARCSAPGYRRQTFKFAAAQVTGASNLRSIQGIFSIGGNDDTGTGGPSCPPNDPGCPYCQFYYDRATNSVLLDDQNAGYTWSGGQSIVGSGGIDLSNGYCKIHAGSSSVQTESKVLSVSLDVEFLSSSYLLQKKHIYEFVTNNNCDAYGNCEGSGSPLVPWTYWGWWSTP